MPDATTGGSAPAPRTIPPWWARWRVRRVQVHDDSMGPTLAPGDRLLVDTAAFDGRPPAVGDVVVLVDPTAPARWLVKRVAGVGPGEFWRTSGGIEPLGPLDRPARPAEGIETLALPPGTVFVLGDAGGRARDSRQFGPVRLDALVGRAYRCYAPADRRRDL